MSKRKKRTSRPAPPTLTRNPPSRVVAGLNEVARLTETGDLENALYLLNELHAQYPNRIEILDEMINLAQEIHDPHMLQYASKRILALQPREPDALASLAVAYMQQGYLALTLRTLREFLALAPAHERAAEIRELVRDIEQKVFEPLSAANEEHFKLALAHEEVQVLLNDGAFAAAERLAKATLRQHPDHLPLLNNLSLIYRQQGNFNLAIETAQQVLERDPGNIHALANLIQYLYLTGREAEARAHAAALKDSTAPAWEGWVKKAESLALLGNDEEVLEIYRLAHLSEEEQFLSPSAWAILAHFAAVASMRLGREDEARRLWREALQYQPGLDVAVGNLDDLDFDLHERNGAWAFSSAFWFSTDLITDIRQTMMPADLDIESPNLEVLARGARRLVRKSAELRALFSIVLAHADPVTRGLLLGIADFSQDRALLNAVKDFALGQRGADSLRFQALRIVTQAQLVPPTDIRMWLEGEWRTISTQGIEIGGEPTFQHRPEVIALLDQATAAGQNQDWKRAEMLFREASALEPDAPDLQGNIAVMLRFQGYEEEAEKMLWDVHRRFPEYVFARLNLARLCISRGETDIAQDLLDPVFKRTKLHPQEFTSLCSAAIELGLATDDLDTADHWLELWESYAPDDPGLDYYYAQMEAASAPPPPAPLPRLKPRRHRSGF